MGFLNYMMERAKKHISENDPKHAQEFINIIERRWDYQMGRDLHLAAYYLNSRFQYTISGIDMDSELLAALRNVIYKMVSDPEIASLCLQETKQFREGSDSFRVPSAVVSKKQMNPAEWWIHFGTSAENLRHMAVRILSQTVSASGCERNWSTFALIHSKQRNRLTQKCLDDLVYIHYNLRLRLKCIQEEV
ncbi:uncharacterized protein [Elaeis guineensis]|uniref:uncharacterized protein n=1 Tax=Elaeis guineensis var. tenera TaxID=51953 RepID=UPI003C6CFF73